MAKVLLISASDFNGAGIATYRFHKNLQNSGFNSKMLVINKQRDDKSVVKIEVNDQFSWFRHKFRRIQEELGFFSKKYVFRKNKNPFIKELFQLEKYIDEVPDIIILNWISGVLSLDLVSKLQENYKSKMFWFIHDMAPLTGGCHCAWDCNGYKSECKKCPAVIWFYRKLPNSTLKKKKALLEKSSFQLLTPSEKLKECVKESSCFKGRRVDTLIHGINKDVFCPVNEDKIKNLRKKYGIPLNKKIIMFSAVNVSGKHKGGEILKKAFELISRNFLVNARDVCLMTVGNNSMFDSRTGTVFGFDYYHLGFFHVDQMHETYQMSDLFVCPTLQDVGPMVVNEALLCGIPVVGFDTGAISELIVTGENGVVVSEKNAKELAVGVTDLLLLSENKFDIYKKKARQVGEIKASNVSQMKTFAEIINKCDR